MPYTKQDVQTLYSLSEEDFNHTLTAAKLPLDKEIYTDEDIQMGVDVVLGYLNSGQAAGYAAASELFEQQIPVTKPSSADNQSKVKKSGKGKKPAKTMDFDSLRSWVSEEVGIRVSPIELGCIIQACGLPDQEEYTQDECDRVREAADIFKNQGKSYAEVADCLGKTNESLNIDADVQEILGMIGSAALSTEEELLQVLNKLSAKRGQAISAMYERLLLTHTAQQLRERQQARDSLTKFGEQLEAFVEGKSSIRTVRMTSPPALDQTTWKSLPESSDKS